MFHIVKYKGVPEIWEEKPHEDIIRHLGTNYSVTGKSFHKKESAKKYLESTKQQ